MAKTFFGNVADKLLGKDEIVEAAKGLYWPNFNGGGPVLPGGVYPGPTLTPDLGGNVNPNDWFFFGNGVGPEYKFNYTTQNDGAKAYKMCPPLTAIVNKKAQSYINGITSINNTKGKPASGDAANRLRKLLAKPNPLQSWKQFEAQQYIYMQIFGWCLTMPIFPAGLGADGPIDASSLWNIPPYMLKITEGNKLFLSSTVSVEDIITKAVLCYKNIETTIDISNCFLFRDFVPSFDSVVLPQSRVQALSLPINNIIGAYESRNVLINYRGALGILTPEAGNGQFATVALSDDDKKQLQRDFSRYGLKGDQWKFIISPAALKWQQMGVPTKDLLLFEEIEGDTQAICDGFNYPYRLLSQEKSASYNDVQNFYRIMYQDGIIPESLSTYEQWNLFFKFDELGLNLRMDKSYYHIVALQEDQLATAQARNATDQGCEREFKNNLITLNQWRSAIGLDTIAGTDSNTGGGDVYYFQMLNANISFGNILPNTENNTPTTPPANTPAATNTPKP